MGYPLGKSTHLECDGNSDLIVPIEYSKDDGIVTPMTMLCYIRPHLSRVNSESLLVFKK